MSSERMGHLLNKVGPIIQKKDASSMKSISPSERLNFILRYLESRYSQRLATYLFRMRKKTASRILSETSKVIVQDLQPLYIPPPSNPKHWKEITNSNSFYNLWQFAHICK